MAEQLDTRRPVARIALLLILIGLGARFAQVAVGEAPPAEAARAGAARELLRVGWLAGCSLEGEVGLYATSEGPCRPGRTRTLAWLQSQLAGPGLVTAGEYLSLDTSAPNRACGARVLDLDGGPRGWLCADAGGVYRIDQAGQDPGSRWQLWSAGTWVQVR
jgi:hypothetical protein